MNASDWFTQKDHGDGIIEIGLNRAPVNALSAAFLMEMARILNEMATDDAVRAVVLSSPFKAFSAGLDLKETLEYDLADEHAIVKGLNTGFTALFGFPKPVVCAVRGAAIAGGLFFVMASDFRISGPRASFGLAEVRVGVDFPVGPMEIARATLGPNALRRLMLTGQPVSATQAAMMGIIDQIEPDEAVVLDRALATAREMAASPPRAYAQIKRQIRGATIQRIQTGMAAGGNAPADGWFDDATKPAMRRMLG